MNEPISPRAAEIIRAALAAEDPPTAQQRARMKRAVLAAALAPGAAAASGGSLLGASKGVAAKGAFAGWVKATALAVVAAGAAAAATQLPSAGRAGDGPALPLTTKPGPRAVASPRDEQPPKREPAALVASPTPTGAQLPAGAERSASEAATRPAPSTFSTPPAGRGAQSAPAIDTHSVSDEDRTTAAAGSDQLQAELVELEQIQAELRAGRGAAALELLDARSGQGVLLEEERLASEVFAACQAGELERAQRAAARFLERSSSSLLAERVRRSCAFAGASDSAADTSRH